MTMKLAVIGEPCIDFIYIGNTLPKKQIGGIFYSLISLAVMGREHEIYPVMNVGEDEYSFITYYLKNFPNIKHDFIFKCSHNTRTVNLYYKDINSVLNTHSKTYDREESSTEPVPPVNLSRTDIEFLLQMDGILVNMVSGKDIELETIEELMTHYNGHVHIDVHNLVMKTLPGGERVRMPVTDWQRWIRCGDTIQMNIAEFTIISGNFTEENSEAEKILNSGRCKALVITKGIEGAAIYTSNNGLRRTDYPSVKYNVFKDSTGCGDVFASAFFLMNLLNNHNYEESVQYAIAMAGRNASLGSVEELEKINEQ